MFSDCFRTGDIAELAGDGTKKIFKPELMNAIQGMHFFIEQPEFEKLWKKYKFYIKNLANCIS